MAEKTIVTQGQLGDLKAALAQEADMLRFHSGDSMSAAHGFNIIQGPVNDGVGNDLSSYQDANGDIVGTHMLHVVINGVDYYAPISPTTLAGQDPLAGVAPNLDPLLQPGNNCWVTDYATEATSDAYLVLSGLLLPHTRQYYAETHGAVNGAIQVATQNVFDSSGHLVGEHVLILYFNSKQLYIPCSTRLGGPPQPARLGNVSVSTTDSASTYTNHASSGHDDNQDAYFYYFNAAAGTQPITFTWQINQESDGSGAWNNLNMTAVWPTAIGGLSDHATFYGIIGNSLRVRAANGSDSSNLMCVIRGKYSNPYGDVFSPLLHFRANDEDGDWIFGGPDSNYKVWYETIPNCLQALPKIHCKPK